MGGSSTSSTSSVITTNSDSGNTTTDLVSNLSNVGNVPINIGSTVGGDTLSAVIPYFVTLAIVGVVALVILKRK